jgi:hypothetical protein
MKILNLIIKIIKITIKKILTHKIIIIIIIWIIRIIKIKITLRLMIIMRIIR